MALREESIDNPKCRQMKSVVSSRQCLTTGTSIRDAIVRFLRKRTSTQVLYDAGIIGRFSHAVKTGTRGALRATDDYAAQVPQKVEVRDFGAKLVGLLG